MGNLKGSQKRLIQPPGYHLHPKYDLHFLRHKLYGGPKGHDEADLPLTSMVDMMSILVVFLLMNFSSTGEVFFLSKGVKIPDAKHGRLMESLPLISILKDGVTLDSEKIGDAEVKMEGLDNTATLPLLRARLQQIRILHQTLRPNEPFKGAVNIQADESTPVNKIKEVMAALIQEGWTGINFAVRPSPTARGTASE
jgi:biopolymer transport protein ExbD